jgi:hypothetical protein
MRVVPFPDGGSTPPEQSWLIELDAALSGEGAGPRAESWRELRDGVRSYAPPIDPDFERRLQERLRKLQQPQRPSPWRRLLAKPRHSSLSGRPAVVALAVTCTLVAVAVLIAPWRSPSSHPIVEAAPRSTSGAAGVSSEPSRALKGDENAEASPSSATQNAAPPSAGVTPASGRVQQTAALLSLTTVPEGVQAIADSVERLAASDGGFVRSANVQTQSSRGEATLVLSLPSGRLDAALASLSRLAPVHSESQSLQDITASYDAARQRLADATAERQALLRALAAASTEAKIQALRAQLAQVRAAVAAAQSALHAESQRASNSELEVSVLGDTHVAANGLSLHRGLHTAGRVLLVSLVVLLVAAAVLVPLALLIAALVGARAMLRRYRRERVLDA